MNSLLAFNAPPKIFGKEQKKPIDAGPMKITIVNNF